MKRLATIAAGVALLGAAPAEGRPLMPPSDYSTLLAAASAYWGTESICPASSITVREVGDVPGGFARAPLGGCTNPHLQPPYSRDDWRWIEIEPGASAARRCAVITHEYGHLLGHEHSPDPASPMHFDGPVVGACRAYQRPARCDKRKHRRSKVCRRWRRGA